MEVLADSVLYYSQVLPLLGFPVYGLNTWRRSSRPPPGSLARFISQAGVIITLRLWSGGTAGRLFPLGCNPGSPPPSALGLPQACPCKLLAVDLDSFPF